MSHTRFRKISYNKNCYVFCLFTSRVTHPSTPHQEHCNNFIKHMKTNDIYCVLFFLFFNCFLSHKNCFSFTD